MKRIILFGLAMSLSLVSQAKDSVETKVDCETVKVELSRSHSELHPVVTWEDKAQFPNPPIMRKIDGKNYSFICPSISSSYDGNSFKLKAPSYEELISLLKGGYSWNPPFINFYDHTTYVYPNIRAEPIYHIHRINIETLDVKISHSYEKLSKTIVMGYKVNNSELKPLYYNGVLSDYKDEMKEADIINIYYSYNDTEYGVKNSIEHILIDKGNGSIELDKSFKFPQL